MAYFYIVFLSCISNFYLAMENKALVYIVFAFIFCGISVLSYFLSNYKIFHFILIEIYGTLIYYLNYQNNIYGEYIADYLLLSVQLGIISLLSLIEVIKDLPPLKRKVFSHNYRFSWKKLLYILLFSIKIF